MTKSNFELGIEYARNAEELIDSGSKNEAIEVYKGALQEVDLSISLSHIAFSICDALDDKKWGQKVFEQAYQLSQKENHIYLPSIINHMHNAFIEKHIVHKYCLQTIESCSCVNENLKLLKGFVNYIDDECYLKQVCKDSLQRILTLPMKKPFQNNQDLLCSIKIMVNLKYDWGCLVEPYEDKLAERYEIDISFLEKQLKIDQFKAQLNQLCSNYNVDIGAFLKHDVFDDFEKKIQAIKKLISVGFPYKGRQALANLIKNVDELEKQNQIVKIIKKSLHDTSWAEKLNITYKIDERLEQEEK